MATIRPYQLTSKKGKDGQLLKPVTMYRVRYRTPDGRQTDKRGFATKRDANLFLATLEVSKTQGGYISPTLGRTTVTAIAETWLTNQVHTKPSWQTRQVSLWRVHVAPQWGARQIATITRAEIREWITRLDRAPSTVTDIHGVLATILDQAVEDKLVTVNPARGVKLPRRTETEHNYLTHAQVRQLADEVSTHSEIVLLLAYTGLRWGEMAALRPRDTDLDRNRILISRSASKVNSQSIIVAPKTWERRTVAAPPEVLTLLLPILPTDSNALIWSRPDGTPLRPPTTTHWFSKAVQRLTTADGSEFPRVTAHELRHTAASLMIASGAHVKTVQRQLGHKSATMTLDLYGHLFDDDLEEISTRMSVEYRAAEKCGQNVGTEPDYNSIKT